MAEVDKSLPGDQPLPLWADPAEHEKRLMEEAFEKHAQQVKDFYEEDEPVENIQAAFEAGEKQVTAPPLTAKTLPQLSANVFKFKYTQREWGEYTVRLFVGPDDDHLQFAGSFTLRNQSEMDDLSLNLGILIGARSQIGLDVTKWWLEESNG